MFQQNISISDYHSNPITVYSPLLLSIPKSRAHHHYQKPSNPYQFLYYYQFWIHMIYWLKLKLNKQQESCFIHKIWYLLKYWSLAINGECNIIHLMTQKRAHYLCWKAWGPVRTYKPITEYPSVIPSTCRTRRLIGVL